MQESSIDHKPAGPKWEFDAAVTACFDDMLERSIPQYHVMRQAVTDIACRFAQDATCILDLGTSTGLALAAVAERRGARNTYLGLEVSEPMIDAARKRFAGSPIDVRAVDLRKDFPAVRASVVLSVLTLQFVPIEYRQGVVQRAYDALEPGGALIVVEKILGSSKVLDDLQVLMYYAMKGGSGYSGELIERKRTALEGVLVPITAHWNEELLKTAGFRHVDCFWRWMNFAGWIAVK